MFLQTEVEMQTREASALSDTSVASARVALPEPGSALSTLDALRSADPTTAAEARDAVTQLVTTLSDIQAKKRRVDDAMQLLLAEVRTAQQLKVRQNAAAALMFFGLGCLFFMLFKNLCAGWMLVVLIWTGAWIADRAVGTCQKAARDLEEAGDPRAVGVLAVALRDGDPTVKRLAESALMKLLPHVRASDAAYFDAEQRRALYAIAYHDDDALKVALLKAMEQFGDEAAIPVVERLMYDPWKTVRDQAAQCLPFVTERAQRAKAGATLLRASSFTSRAVPAELLRPAIGATSETPSTELLRALDDASDRSG